MSDVSELALDVRAFPVNKDFLPQDKLDIRDRERTSLYPWRGQFSPGLIEVLLDGNATGGSTVLDPFVGSGTTLFECLRRGLECYGAEINPAAAELAAMAEFATLDSHSREEILESARRGFEERVSPYLPMSLLRDDGVNLFTAEPLEDAYLRLIHDTEEPYLRSFLVTTLMLAMGDGDDLTPEALWIAYERNLKTVASLPYVRKPCKCYLADARALPLVAGSVDLVVTSPPYINVFNYHQNYRKAIELLGWKPLEVAPSEIGSNRKHRMNRFLTVVQYCMDLVQVFGELRRVMDREGRAVFVVGRESKVRGVPFSNGELLAMFATGGAGFALERWQERRFVNRFGTKIFEEIITLHPNGIPSQEPEEFGRKVGVFALEEALPLVEKADIRQNIEDAIEQAPRVGPSPLLRPVGNLSGATSSFWADSLHTE